MLSDFYRSGDWRDLVNVIKLQRTDDSGNIICEHCQKPIVKAYDCIGHHKIHLTEENYTNAEISLNPENIMLVHHACHNRIHHKTGFIQQRNVFLVYGSPCSGKTTWVRESMTEGDLIVDIDSIWQCVSGCDRYVKPLRLRQNVFLVRDLLIDFIRLREGKWANAYVIGGYPLVSERERLIKLLGARAIFIDTPKAECLERLHKADDGRNVEEWEKFISDWWEKFQKKI